MNTIICAIKDTALDQFLAPLVCHNVAHARRIFTDVLQGDNQLSKHPSDYDLYHLAAWNLTTGKFDNLETPERIARGRDDQPAKDYDSEGAPTYRTNR